MIIDNENNDHDDVYIKKWKFNFKQKTMSNG